MKILDAGHHYELNSYDNDYSDDKEYLRFMKREGENFPFNASKNAGTNCQEVIRALIDRCQYLQKQKPCAETESIIALLQTCLMLFETRAARLHNLSLDLTDLGEAFRANTCKTCGHIICQCFLKTIPDDIEEDEEEIPF